MSTADLPYPGFPDPVSAFGKRYPVILDTIFDQLLAPGDRAWIPEPPSNVDDLGDPVNRVQLANAQLKLPEEERAFVPLLYSPPHPEVERGRLLLGQLRNASEPMAASKFSVSKAWNKYLRGRLRRGKEPGHRLFRAVIRASPKTSKEALDESIREMARQAAGKCMFMMSPEEAQSTFLAPNPGCLTCMFVLRAARGSSYYCSFRGMVLAAWLYEKTGICLTRSECIGVNYETVPYYTMVKRDSPRLAEMERKYVESERSRLPERDGKKEEDLLGEEKPLVGSDHDSKTSQVDICGWLYDRLR